MKQLLLLVAIVSIASGQSGEYPQLRSYYNPLYQQYSSQPSPSKPPGQPEVSGLSLVPADIRSRAVAVTPEVLNSLAVLAPGLRNSVPKAPASYDKKYGGPSISASSISAEMPLTGHWVLYLYCDVSWPFCCHFYWVWELWAAT
jgi:hypothetical protein